MNFIFISPNFPKSYWNFCRGLKNNGVNTLGIGDADYDFLSDELKESLNEYYKVSSLENYDEVYRACAYFAFKYGKIDWLESNNEYWLLRDAQLRTDFNITSGLKNDKIAGIKYKSKMKEFYEKGGKVAAICAAPSVFADLGFLKGRKATSYPSFMERLTGAETVELPVVTDGNVTTSRGLGTAVPFALNLIAQLMGQAKADEVADSIVYQG